MTKKWYQDKEGALNILAPADEVDATKEAVIDPGIRVITDNAICIREDPLRTLRLIDKGTRQAFLDDELGIDDTKSILDQINVTRAACETGDESACVLLGNLVDKLTKSGT